MEMPSEVLLRPMQEADLPKVLAWRNAEGVRKNMYSHHVISPEEHQAWWNAQNANPRTRLLMATEDGRDVGVVIFTSYSGPGGVASWAFYAGEGAPPGIGGRMELAALEHAFNDLKLRKLECEVLDFNMSVVQLHLRHGFSVEGRFHDAYERDGQHHDIYRLALFAEDWQKHIAPLARASHGRRFGLAGKTWYRTITLTDRMVEDFAAWSGDRNPVHFDDQAARDAGFPSRVAHGMLTGSLFSAAFAHDFPGAGTVLLAQTLEFLRPVPIGVTLELRMKVLSQVGRRLTVETQAFIGAECCLSGQASLLLPRNH